MDAPHAASVPDVMKARPDQMLLSLYMLWFQIPYLPEYKASQYVFPRISPSLTKNDRDNWMEGINGVIATGKPGKAFHKDDVTRMLQAWNEPNAMTGMMNYYRAMFLKSNVGDSLLAKPNITVPTLILWGEKDIFGVNEMAEFSYRYCPKGSKLVFVPEATHWITTEEAEFVNNEILKFVK